jgi:hypothetical protein
LVLLRTWRDHISPRSRTVTAGFDAVAQLHRQRGMNSGRLPWAIVGLAVLSTALQLHTDADATRLVPAMQRYLDQEQPLTDYRAFRRIEAQGMGHHGWLEAWTELEGGVFRYEITAEGGSDSVRGRVLRKILQSEREAIANGEAERSALTPENYDFTPSTERSEGLVKVLMKPRHKGKLMLDGAMFFEGATSDLIRVQGRAVSNPSFWVKRVEITKQYQRVNGVNVPIDVTSTANIRFAGKATFHMTYQYTQINGRGTLGTVGVIASTDR